MIFIRGGVGATVLQVHEERPPRRVRRLPARHRPRWRSPPPPRPPTPPPENSEVPGREAAEKRPSPPSKGGRASPDGVLNRSRGVNVTDRADKIGCYPDGKVSFGDTFPPDEIE